MKHDLALNRVMVDLSGLLIPIDKSNLRLCLDHRIFVGKVEETKTEERKMRGTFGTKENSNSFPPEYCTIFKLS